ncbi:MAG: hypothetical protein K9M45_06935, partial [Kiritimatiellales bacterium]|nr:hypothetical protein [Kiritimatiellales bacterium]
LMAMQAAPDSPEDIAKLPLLHRDDLDKKIRLVDRGKSGLHDATILTHDLFTNGILYLDISFELHGLDEADIPYVALLGSALLEMGTQKEDYVSLSQRIARKTGGIYASPLLSARGDSDTGVTRLFLRSKCMFDQTTELLDILHDVLLLPNFDDKERFKQIVLEHKADMETSIVPRGHSAVMTRLKAQYNEAHWIAEQLGGVSAIFFLRQLAKDIETDWPAVFQRLEKIRGNLLNRDHIIMNVTADAAAQPAVFQALETFIEKLPNPGNFVSKDWKTGAFANSEALIAPTMVNYVGRSANLFDTGYKMHGSALVITRYLQTAWLWEKIRVQGGAYGGMCSFDRYSGVFAFASYRDPNLAASLDVYDQTGAYLRNLQLDEDELTRSIIGAIGQLDSYQLPDAKGFSDTVRYLLNFTDEERQQIRDEVLGTTQKDFAAFGEVLDTAMKQSATAVLCSPDAITAAEKAGLKIDKQTKVL